MNVVDPFLARPSGKTNSNRQQAVTSNWVRKAQSGEPIEVGESADNPGHMSSVHDARADVFGGKKVLGLLLKPPAQNHDDTLWVSVCALK